MSKIRVFAIASLVGLFIMGTQDAGAQLMAEHIVFEDDAPKKSRKKKEKDENKGFFFGGNLGGGYDNGWTVLVAPVIGYQFSSKIRTSTGAEYYYSNYNFRQQSSTISSIGPFVNAQYLVATNFFLQAEYQYQDYNFNGSSFADNFLFFGGGYTSSFGKGAGYNLTFLYNVLYDSNDPNRLTNTPVVIRAGFVYGI